MPKYRRASIILLSFAISFLLLLVVLGSSAQASELASTGRNNTDTIGQDFDEMDRLLLVVDRWLLDQSQLKAAESDTLAPNILPSTTLTIANISSIWAPIDKLNPNTGPRVFVVEAEVSNIGSNTAETVSVTLDYNEDPSNDWVMVNGEEPVRTIPSLDPGQKYYAYWFVSYPGLNMQSHQYTITVDAANALPVSTADNAFNTPGLSTTVQTREYQPTGNNGPVTANTNVVVGVAYTITVEYDVGKNPNELTYSPVGNVNFDPSATRLLSTTISFQNSQGTTETVVYDKLYFPSLPLLPDGSAPKKSVTTYKFLSLKPVETYLCAYTAIRYQSDNSNKYDKEYCDTESVIHITGTNTISLSKSASSGIVLQDDFLTYTITYTNYGTVDTEAVWIWDEIDPALASVVSNSKIPTPTLSDGRVAWFLDKVPAGSSGTLTITAQIDGNGQDLPDGISIVNNAYFGINPGTLPFVKAMTSTVTSTLEAPAITIGKSDGLSIIGAGESFTYTINLINDGSVPAMGLVLTDVLPAGVSLVGNPFPAPDEVSNGVIKWYSSTLGSLEPNGGALTITIPVSVDPEVGDGKILTNSAEIQYQNDIGHVYQPLTAEDTTIVTKLVAYVEGIAFEDLDGNGTKDVLEPGIPGIKVELPEAISPTVTTNSNGYYSFQVNAGKPVSATASLPAGYFRTTPGLVFFRTTLGLTKNVNFGYAKDNSAFGVVYGTVFEDADQNRLQNLSEAGLSEVAVASTEATTTPMMSNNLGQYTLRFDNNGSTTISETNPPGYVSTTPDIVAVDVITGSSNSSPVDFGDFQGIKITGMVFEDNNLNGVNDGENGVAGAIVQANGLSMTTGLSGVYTFYLSTDGQPITVTETDPPGYISTNAVPGSEFVKIDNDTLHISNPVSGTVYTSEFGDVMAADLSISKTGVPDPVAVGGILTYTIVYTNDGPSDANDVVITDTLDDHVSFSGLVSVNPPMDNFNQSGQILTWTKSLVNPGTSGEIVFNATVQPDALGVITNTIQISASTADQKPENNQDQITVSIGDPTKATIYGYAFEDINGNGEKDSGEPGIPGVVVKLDQIITATTDAGGLYFFTTSVSGTHAVVETQPPGYLSTTPDEVHLAVMLGEIYRVDFGDAPDDAGFAAIYGTVFEDSNSDGTWDVSETGLENVTITLSATESISTDLYGRFTFSTTITGDHTVVETDPDYYFSTTPNTVTVDVELNKGYQVNFGDVRADMARCPADAFEEDDANNQAKDLTVGRVQKHDFCDDAVDWTKISVIAGRTYTITTSSWGQRADTFLALFDLDGQTLLAANDDYAGSGDYSSQLMWKATATGELFVRTTNRVNLEGFLTEYDIRVDEEKGHFLFLPILVKNQGPTAGFGQPALFSIANLEPSFIAPDEPDGPMGEIFHACPDFFEIDDTWQQANSIEAGVPQLHWFDSDPIIYAADKDFVSFDLQTGQEITFTVTSTTTEVLLELYDDQGNFMGLSGTDLLHIEGVQVGKYFLSASPIAKVSGCREETGYQLLAEKNAQYVLHLPIIIN